MIKNYIKIAWRNLLRNKLYSAINIGGLAIGMAVSFMLLLYVYNEFSFDKFNINSARLYQVFINQKSNGNINTESSTPVPLADVLQKDIPEIEKVARCFTDDILVNYKNKAIKLNMLSADASLLDLFSFDFIYGDKRSALSDVSSIVLTQSGAKAIFGNINPVGRVIKFDTKYPLKVSAVIKDNPHNSSFSFKGLISWQTIAAERSWIKKSSWGNCAFTTYVLLKPGSSVTAADSKIKNIFTHYDPGNKDSKLFLYPFTRIHLHSEFKNGVSTGGSIEFVRLFLMLAIGILLIACINFMNLSTARSAQRAREVGIRKTIGARRFALVQQFIGESLLMALLAFILSLLLMQLLLPVFNTIIHGQLTLPYGNGWAWAAALGITVFTGLIAGSYPALLLSSFNPVKVLKGQLITTKTTIRPRQVLVIIQFTFAICLILSSLFIYKQINYIKNKPVGYDQNNLVEMPVQGKLINITGFESFRQDALTAGAIADGAMSSGSITNHGENDPPYTWGVTWPGQLPGEDKLLFDQIAVSYHYTNTYGLKLVQGHDFTMGYPADTMGVILNEAAVKTMRLKEPLGQKIKWQGQMRTVVGVVKDFVFGSPYQPAKPAILGFMKDWTGGIGLRLNPNNSISKNLALLQAIYKKYNPEYPFEYSFADDTFAKKFNNEKILGSMSAGFTCLAIIISCLGLFGLASFSAQQRKKETGIRKVLGAGTGNLWFKLSAEFVKLVLLSFIIGSAISWYNIQQWLAKYTYHTPLSIWVFAITLLISLVICLIAVSWQAIKAAWANPVESLRSE